jgi:hypothetical protein
MVKLALSAAAVIAVVAAMFAPSVVAQQGVQQLDYVRVTPHIFTVSDGPNRAREWVGYRSCQAAHSEWTCRKFESTESGDVALRTALVTLGNERWELVSAVQETRGENLPGLTYLFKRPR